MSTQLTSKGERTRSLLLSTALGFFRQGHDPTMREIAKSAGLSLGNAYYYFPSKEHLVQAFYALTHEEHLAACADVLDRERSLKKRMLGTLETKLATLEPYHAFSGRLFGSAGNPRSPLSPFSEESRPVREEAIALWSRVLAGARTRVPADLAAELPLLLWLYQMGILLFWLHDDSPGRRRSRVLVERSVELVVRMLALASSPLLRPLRTSTLRLFRELRRS